jgi:hypothetical protein
MEVHGKTVEEGIKTAQDLVLFWLVSRRYVPTSLLRVNRLESRSNYIAVIHFEYGGRALQRLIHPVT